MKRHGFVTATADIPSDPALPGLARLLDPEWMKRAVEEQLFRSGCTVLACHPRYVRYKPGTNCIVAYDLEYASEGGEGTSDMKCYAKCYTTSDFDNAARKAQSRQWIEDPRYRPSVLLNDERTIVYAYPNDAELDGLRLLSDSKKLQRVLYDHHALLPSDDWRISDKRLNVTTIRYKPEKRAVFRVDTRAVNRNTGEKRKVRVYMRTYNAEQGAEIFSLMQHLYHVVEDNPEIAVPQPFAYLSDRNIVLVDNAEGTPLIEQLAGPSGTSAAAATGTALARLHMCPTAGLRVRMEQDLLADARDSGRSLAHVAPEIGAEVTGVLERLAERAVPLGRSTPSFVHGDFYYGQVLSGGERITILDFDRAYAGDPAADLGNFNAHLHLSAISEPSLDRRALARAFTEAYEEASGGETEDERLRFWTGYGLFQLAISPFRSLAPSWKNQIADVIAECRRILG